MARKYARNKIIFFNDGYFIFRNLSAVTSILTNRDLLPSLVIRFFAGVIK